MTVRIRERSGAGRQQCFIPLCLYSIHGILCVAAYVGMLEEVGPGLRYPYCSGVAYSRHARTRELRAQHQGRPYRVLYAFDPRRTAILLIGGDKTGKDRWYEEYVPVADRIYDEHLNGLRKEEESNGKEV